MCPAQEHEQVTERPEFSIKQVSKAWEIFLFQQGQCCHKDLLQEVFVVTQAVEKGHFPRVGWVRSGEQGQHRPLGIRMIFS